MEKKNKEAFCLMTYKCQSCGREEEIWNSRDGVTPFSVSCKCRGIMNHVRWNEDLYAPAYVPSKGQRIFVDLTEERYAEITKAKIDYFWDNDNFKLKEQYKTKEEALEQSLSGFMPGSPDIVPNGVVEASVRTP